MASTSAEDTAIPLGSVWRENDKRAQRLIRVVADGRDPKNVLLTHDFRDAAVRVGSIGIVTIDRYGRRVNKMTFAKPERFGRSGGYAFVRHGIAADLEALVVDVSTGRWGADPQAIADGMRAWFSDHTAISRSIDVESLLVDTVPGGSSCDPRAVADDILVWLSQRA